MTYLPLQLDDQVYFSTTWPRLARRREVGEGKMERRLVRFHSAGTSRPNLEASLNHGGFFSVRNGPEGITQCCRHGCEDGPIFLPLKWWVNENGRKMLWRLPETECHSILGVIFWLKTCENAEQSINMHHEVTVDCGRSFRSIWQILRRIGLTSMLSEAHFLTDTLLCCCQMVPVSFGRIA